MGVTVRDCKDTRRVERLARDHGLDVVNGKGDHVKIVDPNTGQHVTIYAKRELSIGVAHQVFKFFLRVGVLSFFVLLVRAFVITAMIKMEAP